MAFQFGSVGDPYQKQTGGLAGLLGGPGLNTAQTTPKKKGGSVPLSTAGPEKEPPYKGLSAVQPLKQARDNFEQQYGISFDMFQQALQSFQEGFPGVMAEITSMGDASRQSAYNEYQQRLGAGSQGLVSRGLGNTTVRNNFASGESSRYLSNLAQINEGLASLRSGVKLQGLGMQAGLMQQLGGVHERQAAGYTGIQQGISNARWNNVMLNAEQQIGFGDLAQVGAGIGSLFGGAPGLSAAAGKTAATTGFAQATATMPNFGALFS